MITLSEIAVLPEHPPKGWAPLDLGDGRRHFHRIATGGRAWNELRVHELVSSDTTTNTVGWLVGLPGSEDHSIPVVMRLHDACAFAEKLYCGAVVGPPIPTPEQRTLCREALDALEARKQEPLESWSERVARHVHDGDVFMNPTRNVPTHVLRDVVVEREKQRSRWGDVHDDEHDDFALATVAAHLACPAHANTMWGGAPIGGYTTPAPEWGRELRKKHSCGRTGQRQRLVVAAALLLAEIERLDRARVQEGGQVPEAPPERGPEADASSRSSSGDNV